MNCVQKFTRWATKRRHKWVRIAGTFPTYICLNCGTIKRSYLNTPNLYLIPYKFGTRTCYHRPGCQSVINRNKPDYIYKVSAINKEGEVISGEQQ